MTRQSSAERDDGLRHAIRRSLRGSGRRVESYRIEAVNQSGWCCIASIPACPDMSHVDLADEVVEVSTVLAGPVSRAYTAFRVVFLVIGGPRKFLRIGRLEAPKR